MKTPTFIALVIIGCGGQDANPTHHYHLVVDSAFSDAQIQAIFDAATEWQSSSGNYVTFDGEVSANDVITFRPRTSAELTSEFGGGTIGYDHYQGQSSTVDLLTTLDAQTFHQTALHEIGHALGLVHTTPGTVMCRDTTCATLIVTCGDLGQLMHYKVTRGCFP